MHGRRSASTVIAAVALLIVWCAMGPAKAGTQKEPKPEPKMTRLTVVLTGGDGNKPVPEASVYLKYVVPGKHGGGKKFELNLKTNQEGEAHSPEIPQGEVLVQIVVPDWKTFGQYYQLQEDEQTIQIHLDRPNSKFY
jgi:hypothetical protein